jgi:hypothetical protein
LASTRLVLNGDTCDFYTISAVDQRTEERATFAARSTPRRSCWRGYGKSFRAFRSSSRAGNHEERWKHWLWQHAPEISATTDAWASISGWNFAEHGIELVEDQRPIMCGELPILHGHEKGKGIS